MFKPAQYWRSTFQWQTWIGRKGKVVASTIIQIAPPELKEMAPYSYVIVDFGDKKMEFMGIGHEQFAEGDEVICVLRKLNIPNEKELIPYGIKVKKVRN